MNTYIYAGGSSLLTMKDNDIKNFDTISNHYLNIDWAWVIEEDGTFVANKKEYNVKAGDVILVLYAGYREKEVPVKDRRKVRDIAIIRNEDLYNNFKLNKKYKESQNSGNCIKSCCPEEPCSEC
jgi:hypothetical protein